MYHYTESGLNNVYLINGFAKRKTPYGPVVVVENAKQLHKMIAIDLVSNKKFLTGPEFRFLRKELGMPQKQIASIIGYDVQTVARWEKLGRVPKWADHAIRYIYTAYVTNSTMKSFVDRVQELEHERIRKRFNYRHDKTAGWESGIAATA